MKTAQTFAVVFAEKFAIAALISAATSAVANPDYGGYKGRGGMAAFDIKPNVYAYHYDKGFTGPDAGGWDPQLQFVWSRMGAAQSCGVAFDEAAAFKQLEAKYPHGETVHRMVGVGFHAAQSKASANAFCTSDRLIELRALLPAFERGGFLKTGSESP